MNKHLGEDLLPGILIKIEGGWIDSGLREGFIRNNLLGWPR